MNVSGVNCSLLVLICQLLAFTSATAQRPPSHTIHWWEAAITVGAIGAVSAFDRRVDDWVQARRSSRSDAISRAFRNGGEPVVVFGIPDRKSTRLNSSHQIISYAVFCLKKKKK